MSHWLANLYLKAYTFCLYFFLFLHVDPIRIRFRIHNTGRNRCNLWWNIVLLLHFCLEKEIKSKNKIVAGSSYAVHDRTALDCYCYNNGRRLNIVHFSIRIFRRSRTSSKLLQHMHRGLVGWIHEETEVTILVTLSL